MHLSKQLWRYLALPVSFAAMLGIGSAAELNSASRCIGTGPRTRTPFS